MKFDTNTIWGFIFFAFGSLLYSANQTLTLLLFANQASQVIFVLLCYAMITLGIAMVNFEGSEIWAQAFVGFLSIIFLILIMNAALLVYDAFNTFRYASTDYFALLKDAISLVTIPDEIALLLVAIAPALGILLWWAISYNDVKNWWELAVFALVVFCEMIIFTAVQDINIFAI